MTSFTRPIGATTLIQAGQPCGDSHIPDGHECRIGGGDNDGRIAAPYKRSVKPDKEGDLGAEMAGGVRVGTTTEKAEDGDYTISMHRIKHADPSAAASRIYNDFQGVGNVGGVKLHKPTKSMHRVEVTSEDGNRHWFFISDKY